VPPAALGRQQAAGAQPGSAALPCQEAAARLLLPDLKGDNLRRPPLLILYSGSGSGSSGKESRQSRVPGRAKQRAESGTAGNVCWHMACVFGRDDLAQPHRAAGLQPRCCCNCVLLASANQRAKHSGGELPPPPPLPPPMRSSRAAPTNLINPCGCCVFQGRAPVCFPSVLCLLQRTSLRTALPGLRGCWLSQIGGRGVNVIESFHGRSAGNVWCRSHGRCLLFVQSPAVPHTHQCRPTSTVR
jgi:hypothetical protein